MKQTLLTIAAVIGIASAGFSQQEELKSAGANIESKNYIAALDDLNKAKKKVSDLMTNQLATVLPKKFGEFEMQDDGGHGSHGQGASLNKTYMKPEPEVKNEVADPDDGMPELDAGMDPSMMGERERLSVTITTNMMMANEVMNAHSRSEDGRSDGRAKPIRVKGFRATVRTEEFRGMGRSEEVHVIVGGAFIKVEMRGVKEFGQAEKFLELIDFDKLKSIVGE